jgi:DNA-binding NarL/FixJ family response regulator
MSIRVILVDDHPIVLHGLQQLFERHDEFEVVAGCSNGNSALEAVRRTRPDVVVLDLRMPGTSGLDVLRTIASEHMTCRTVLLTAAIRDEDAVHAVQLGAKGIVLKDSQPESLLECVRRVHRGEQWIDRDTLDRAVERVNRPDASDARPAAPLTPREMEIVQMVAQGLRNRVIAERLSISEGTVKVHLHNIYEKFNVDGRLELVLLAQDRGLI